MNKKEQSKNLTISFKLSTNLNQKMNEQVVSEGYGMRGKSRWVKEAIYSLLDLEGFPEYVYLSDELKGSSNSISVRLPSDLVLKIEQAVVDVRKDYLGIEGVKSKIMRTAILQRMVRT